MKSGVSRCRTSTVSRARCAGAAKLSSIFGVALNSHTLQGDVATKLSYGGKFFILVMSHVFLIPTLKEFKQESHAVAGKPRDAAVISDRYQVCWHFAGAISAGVLGQFSVDPKAVA